jgi:hypothetical protein
MEINDILLEWSYRLKKGYPTMEDGKFTDPNELKVLHEILKENGINEMPSFVKSKTPVSDVVVEAEGKESDDKEIAATIPNPEESDVPLVDKATLKQVRDKFEETMKVASVAGPRTLAKLYNRISAFVLYLPMKGAMEDSGFKTTDQYDIPDAVATKLQTKLESLDPKNYKEFMDFIQTPKENKPKFPVNKDDGNIYTLLKESPGSSLVADDILKAIGETADTDQSGLGVGMGEYLLALSFSNIFAAEGAGDLALNSPDGPSFEVKGNPARLGTLGPSADKIAKAKHGDSNKTFKERFDNLKLDIFTGMSGHKDSFKTMAEALVAKHKELDSEGKKNLVKLVNDVNHYAQQNVDKDAKDFDSSLDLTDSDFNNEVKLNNKLGAQGLNAYMNAHNQQAFIALDMGKQAPGEGYYMFSAGGANEAAKLFGNHNTKVFQNWRLNLTRPRVIYKK